MAGRSRKKRDRTVYLKGPKAGQPRPSSATRKRRRQAGVGDRRRDDDRAMEELVRELIEEEFEDAKAELQTEAEALGQVTRFRLGRGYREVPEGQTEYSMYDEEESEWLGKLVLVGAADMESGRRWFHEGYPEWLTDKYTKRELQKKFASQNPHDYGKYFVEHRGRWYEARLE